MIYAFLYILIGIFMFHVVVVLDRHEYDPENLSTDDILNLVLFAGVAWPIAFIYFSSILIKKLIRDYFTWLLKNLNSSKTSVDEK